MLQCSIDVLCIPHVCGGEPYKYLNMGYQNIVFPMYVGVNRCDHQNYLRSISIPHVCGGEPTNTTSDV